MNIESITTLEEALDFLAARYPGHSMKVGRDLWKHDHLDEVSPEAHCISILKKGGRCLQTNKQQSLQEAVRAIVDIADNYDPEAEAKREVEEARAKLESAGYSVIAPDGAKGGAGE